MSRFRLICLALLGAAAVSLVACGDTAQKNDYVDQVNKVTTNLASEVSTVSTQTGESAQQLTDSLRTLSMQVDEAVTELDSISPPSDVADLHDRLVQDLKTFADETAGAANDLEAGGPASTPGVATQLIAQMTKLQTEVQSTIGEINSKLQG